MKFLFQTFSGNLHFDFQHVLLEKLKYINWWENREVHSFSLTEALPQMDAFKDCIPVGSLEFSLGFYKHFLGIDIKPIDITSLGYKPSRKMWVDTTVPKGYFYKSKNKYKSLIGESEHDLTLEEPCIISEIINFTSEYRAFYHRGEVIGLHQYTGDWREIQNLSFKSVERISKECGLQNFSGTFDFGLEDGFVTHLIEIHPIFSCGLYGFAKQELLDMYINCDRQLRLAIK